ERTLRLPGPLRPARLRPAVWPQGGGPGVVGAAGAGPAARAEPGQPHPRETPGSAERPGGAVSGRSPLRTARGGGKRFPGVSPDRASGREPQGGAQVHGPPSREEGGEGKGGRVSQQNQGTVSVQTPGTASRTSSSQGGFHRSAPTPPASRTRLSPSTGGPARGGTRLPPEGPVSPPRGPRTLSGHHFPTVLPGAG